MPINDRVATDAEIRERDGGKCARCGGNQGGLHTHHRWMRSAGADERACNRVTLCAHCHIWAHKSPAKATEEGWLVSRYDDPGQVPVTHFLWPGVQILLTDENAGVKIWLKDD
jgi:hypothetical protein